MRPAHSGLAALSLFLSLAVIGCQSNAGPDVLTADMPLHLEAHLDDATIVGSEVPADLPEPVEWRCRRPRSPKANHWHL